MESANFHHHQQQEDHQIGLSWYQNSILNGTRNNTNSRDVIKQYVYDHNVDLMPISQDLGLPFTTTNTSVVLDESFIVHELQHFVRLKHELLVTGSYLGLPKIISSPTSSVEDFMSKNNHQRTRYNNDNDQCMLFNTLSNGCQIKNDQYMDQIPSSEELISYPNNDANSYRGTFSQIFPTVNISNLNQQSSIFDINLPALDPFGSPTFNGSFNYQPASSLKAHNLEGRFIDNRSSYGVDHTDSKIAQALIVETTDAKRPAKNYEATPTKKSKLQLRPSCTPLKVRKEKLGDRISALQQMVAPFGKTDTASVLMEAIGYIKFLQHQVETLSVPYMNSTHKASKISTRGGSIIDGNEETKRNLRSRGLCLVPISCLSYVTYGGGSIWTTP